MNGSDPGSALGVMPTPKKEVLFVHDLLNSTRDLLLILLRVLSLFVPLCFELRPNPRVDKPTSDGRTKFIATIIAFHCVRRRNLRGMRHLCHHHGTSPQLDWRAPRARHS